MKYFNAFAEIIATISDFDERKRVAESIACLANYKNLDRLLWDRACKVSGEFKPETKVEEYCRIKERVLAHDAAKKDMVIWVRGSVVGANCDQCAVVIEVIGSIIRIRLLGNNVKSAIRPDEITGVEIDEGLTILFKYNGHRTTEIHCYYEGK